MQYYIEFWSYRLQCLCSNIKIVFEQIRALGHLVRALFELFRANILLYRSWFKYTILTSFTSSRLTSFWSKVFYYTLAESTFMSQKEICSWKHQLPNIRKSKLKMAVFRRARKCSNSRFVFELFELRAFQTKLEKARSST